MMWGYPGYGYDGGWWLGMALMMFFGLIMTIGVILLIVWLARGWGRGGGIMYQSGTSSACDIAKQRYARGEISREEFQEICRTVGG